MRKIKFVRSIKACFSMVFILRRRKRRKEGALARPVFQWPGMRQGEGRVLYVFNFFVCQAPAAKSFGRGGRRRRKAGKTQM